MPSFNAVSRRYTLKIVKKSKICKQGGKLDYSRYSQVSLLIRQTLRILKMVIAKDH